MDSGSQWVIKLGPIERQNGASTRPQSESGAQRLVLDAAKDIMKKAAGLAPEFLEGVVAPTGFGKPEVSEEAPEAELHSYQLSNGSWFTVAKSNVFGFKVSCKKA